VLIDVFPVGSALVTTTQRVLLKHFMLTMRKDGITTSTAYYDARRECKYQEFPSLPHVTYKVPFAYLLGGTPRKLVAAEL
jgi:hypothetical protein